MATCAIWAHTARLEWSISVSSDVKTIEYTAPKVMAYIVMAYIVTAYMVIANIFMACIVMVHIAMD